MINYKKYYNLNVFGCAMEPSTWACLDLENEIIQAMTNDRVDDIVEECTT